MNASMLISSLLLLLLLQFNLCSSKDTITMTSTFKDGDLLISGKKKFALGFFSPDSSSNRYLGIWFYEIPEQTVVWVANRNHTINGSSGFLSINQQGNLVLYDKNILVWSTNVSAEAKSTLAVQLLDSGNLVLVQGPNKIWQSFDYPTHTILPGMKLGVNKKTGMNLFLTSWRSANDPRIGHYSFELNQRGSPQLYLKHGTRVLWRSYPWPWRIYSGQQYNYSFDYFENEIYHRFLFEDESILRRYVLEDTGLLKWLLWHENDKQWKEFSTSQKDRCDYYRKCGVNGYCAPNILTLFECECLPGYGPKHPRNWQMRDGSDGCIRKRLQDSSVCGHGEGFIKVENVKIPDTSAAIWVGMSMNRMECEEECKKKCSCTAYASIPFPGKGNGCLAWYGELIDTRNYIGYIGDDLYVRVDKIELAERTKRSSGILKMKKMLILSVIATWFLIVVFIIFWIRIRKKKRSRTMKRRLNQRLSNPTSGANFHGNKLASAGELGGRSRSESDFVHFNFGTILAATNNFSAANKIGQGGFGTVYKGQLLNGQEIAVKRMSQSSRQGIQAFKNEVMLISKLQHKNLVKLLGCCIKKKEQLLIYEYLPNKSLDSFLFDETRRLLMDWRKRFDIVLGIARGLLYLHQDSRVTVIHRDLKCSNILLDAEMNPKISDFGMATMLHNDHIQGGTTSVGGTYGYMPPEYALLGKFSAKSDVYSFGVILFEVISGKKINSLDGEDTSISLIEQVWELWNKGKALEIVDSPLKESCNSDEALRCIQVGLLCVQEDAVERPNMLEVILMLKSETSPPPPKQPAFIFRRSLCNTRLPTKDEETCSVNEMTISEVLIR